MDKFLIDNCPTLVERVCEAIDNGTTPNDLILFPIYHLFGAWATEDFVNKHYQSLKSEFDAALQFINDWVAELRFYNLQKPSDIVNFVYTVLADDFNVE